MFSIFYAHRLPLLITVSLILGGAFFAPLGAYAYEVSPSGAIIQSSCSGGTLSVCGIAIPMPPTTSAGNTVDVHVPPSLLGDSTKVVTFTVECVDNGNGGANYQAVNMAGISCSAFPCQASTVRLCDMSIPVTGGTPLGGLVHMTMPQPYNSPFTVSCVGSVNGPPTYQISDHSAVACVGPAR